MLCFYSEHVRLENLSLHEHFVRNLAEKIEVEKQKQDEGLNEIRSAYFHLQDSFQSSLSILTKLFEKKHSALMVGSFAMMKREVTVSALELSRKQNAARLLSTLFGEKRRKNLVAVLQAIYEAGEGNS